MLADGRRIKAEMDALLGVGDYERAASNLDKDHPGILPMRIRDAFDREVAGAEVLKATWPRRCRQPAHNYTTASGYLGHDQTCNGGLWVEAIHRIATEGISPEQAVDEAIVRIKEILG
jgi:hypothetical protein